MASQARVFDKPLLDLLGKRSSQLKIILEGNLLGVVGFRGWVKAYQGRKNNGYLKS